MNNSQNAITVIYREHWQKLYIHAYNLLNDEESAKDVVNDVFCSVLESNERLTTEEDLLPLFFVMVRNRCIDQIRHQNVVHKNAERYLMTYLVNTTISHHDEIVVLTKYVIRTWCIKMRKDIWKNFTVAGL